MAAWAGADWGHRFPVFNRKLNRTEHIEGPSIKCANNVARLYGNCQVDTRVVDGGSTWIIYARFVDYETGFSMTRPFQQDKAAAKLGGDDAARKRDIALQIGVSKAIRNVVCNALEFFTDYAFEQSKQNLVERVGKKLDDYKQRIADRLAQLGVAMDRVERTLGKTIDKWTAPDAAKVIAELQAVSDGMAMADDVWPKPAPPEPQRGDDEVSSDHGADESMGEAGTRGTSSAATGSSNSASEAAAGQPEPKVWAIKSDLLGQQAIVKALYELIGIAESDADLDEIERQNADRIQKFGTRIRAEVNDDVQKKRTALAERAGR
jgi:hypothetical protein